MSIVLFAILAVASILGAIAHFAASRWPPTAPYAFALGLFFFGLILILEPYWVKIGS